jgi:UDP-N-acetylglucosamine 4,6-dehydratase
MIPTTIESATHTGAHVLSNARVLVTGGTGSFGQAFVDHVLTNHVVRELVVFSRDEFKQHEMAQRWPVDTYPIRYFLGDIRDKERLLRAFNGINYVVHAAALKQVPAIEQNPFEAVRTNILGAQNIVEAALERGVRRVVAISTDKAVNPVNLYGATKLAMEKLMIAANTYARYRDVRFSVVRYGNVVGSRGSVLQLYANLIAQGERILPVTDPAMTRFWITLDRGVRLVLQALEEAQGGEIFIPKIPSMSVGDLLAAMPVECTQRTIGRRPGEKQHESLIGEGEGARTLDRDDSYVVMPEAPGYRLGSWAEDARRAPADFKYNSDTNTDWVSLEEMRQLVTSLVAQASAPLR